VKSHFKLYVALTIALLIALGLGANAFFSSRLQPTAKIQAQAETTASSPAKESASSPLRELLPSPSRRAVKRKPFSSSIGVAPKVVESNIRETAHDADVTEATSEVSKESGSPVLSAMKDLRTRALKGQDNQAPAQQTIAQSDVQNVTDRKPIASQLTRSWKSFTGDLRDLPYEKSVAREMPEHDDPYTVRS
jgi:hypothetical protein